MNNENKPQEVPQVKKCKCGGRTALCSGSWYYEPDDEPYENGKIESAKTTGDEEWVHGYVCDDCGSVQHLFVDKDSYTDRIAELEALQLSQFKHEKSLKKQIEDYQALIDKHINSPQNYTDEYIIKVIAQNAVYREALEKIVKVHELDFFGDAVIRKEIAEQALNPKDNG